MCTAGADPGTLERWVRSFETDKQKEKEKKGEGWSGSPKRQADRNFHTDKQNNSGGGGGVKLLGVKLLTFCSSHFALHYKGIPTGNKIHRVGYNRRYSNISSTLYYAVPRFHFVLRLSLF